MDMLALMHEGLPYGHLTVGGEAVTDLQLARMVGETPARVRKLLKELEAHGVFSRTDSGVMFSRRMVRDEHHRNVRAAGGVKSLQHPNVPRPKDTVKPKAKDGGKDTQKDTFRPSLGGSPSSSSSSSPSGTNSLSAAAPPKLELEATPISWPADGAAYWAEHVGPIEIPRFGRAMKPMVDKYGWPDSRNAMIAYIEVSGASTRKVEYLVGDAVRWIALGKQPLIDRETGAFTERGKLAERTALRSV